MSNYTFIKKPKLENEFDVSTITFNLDDVDSLSDLLEYMDDFIKACGYSPKGELNYFTDDETIY